MSIKLTAEQRHIARLEARKVVERGDHYGDRIQVVLPERMEWPDWSPRPIGFVTCTYVELRLVHQFHRHRRGIVVNIFALDDDPIIAAQSLVDQHTGKMLLESCQLLCNAYDEPKGALHQQWLPLLPVERAKLGLLPYKRTHYNNRFSVWARASQTNWLWLWQHAQALAQEHRYRFDKGHGSEIALDWLRSRLPSLSATGRTHFAMPDQYRGDDAVAAYRRYYAAEKMVLRGKPVTWTRRERPPWLPEKT